MIKLWNDMKNLLIQLFLLSIVFGCGEQLKITSKDHFKEVVAKGLKVERPESQIRASLELTDDRQSVYRAYSFNSDPQIISRLEFDSKNMASMSGSYSTSCLEYIDKFRESFGIDTLNSLVFHSEKKIKSNLTRVSFSREINGVKVKNAFVDCYFWGNLKSYKLREIVNDGYFHINVLEEQSLDRQSILQALSLNEGQISGDIEKQYLISDDTLISVSKIKYQTDENMYTLFLNNFDGSIVQGAPHKLHFESTLKGDVYYRSYLETNLFDQILPLTPIFTNLGKIQSNRLGEFSTQGEVESIQLKSSRVMVYDEISVDPITINNFSLTDGIIKVAPSQQEMIGLNSYASIHRLNKFVRQYVSPLQVPFLDSWVDVRVNQEGRCNAYYTTNIAEISLFKEGGGCANIGLVNDVIHHEWGHAIDDHTGREPGVTDGAFSEGIGDIVSAYYNQDPVIGVGFVQDETYGIRRIDSFKKYPNDTGEVHREGGIIASAFWNLHQRLVEKLGVVRGRNKANELFFQHLLSTDSYLESYNSLIRIDDDDGDPSTQSPNFCLINEVFSAHGLAISEGCSDVSYRFQEPDKTMNIALYDYSDGGVGLVASSQSSGVMFVCFGSERECITGRRTHFPLKFIDQNGESHFYNHEGSLDLSGTDYVTLIRKDSQDAIVGLRVLKIFTR